VSRWSDPEAWKRLHEGEGCPICASTRADGKYRGTIVELDTGYLTTQRDQPVRGYCCLVLKRHAVELHDLEEDEAERFMRDMRRVSRALKAATGAVKMNLEIQGNTIPNLHAHFFPRYVGDRFEDGPIDPREPWLPDLPAEEFEAFLAGLRVALEGD
jgi:diadenosine tetraphosphate (Ap4A) HIT family hydrolase